MVIRLDCRDGVAGGAETLSAPRGYALLLVIAEGECAFEGPEGRLRPMRRHEVLVADGETPLRLRPGAGARLAGLAAPVHLLAPRFLAADRLRAACLHSHGLGMGSLLYDLLLRFCARGAAVPGPAGLTDAVGGLLSAMLEDCVPAGRPARGDAGHARLEQINRHLRRHFADPDLSAADVAAAVGVSRRYLHRLFAQHGRSFRDELIALRIEACVQAFLDESQAGRTIAEIAFAAGYADISQFNRHFRRLRGATPSDLRRGARARQAPEAIDDGRRLGRAA
jgi:AraC-like DNA-binding protein